VDALAASLDAVAGRHDDSRWDDDGVLASDTRARRRIRGNI
jgi:hypothetical protein